MKKSFFTIALLAVAAFAFSSCAEIQPQESKGTHTIKMSFNGSVAGYENTVLRDSQTRADALSWKDGDKIYMTFFNGETIVPGMATYSTSDGWTLSYDGSLATGLSLRCEARFFVNSTNANSYLVNINDGTEIYEDLSSTYNYDGSSLTVTAELTPKVGRIRFTGNPSDKVYITGITHYSSFTPASNSFSSTGEVVNRVVQSSGSTDYVYGYFTYEDCRLGLVGSDCAFTRLCSNSIFGQGQSGFMKIPTESSHNNWRNGLLVLANGVEFKMIPVTGYSGGFFLFSETEITNALVCSVNGSTTSYPQLPYSDTGYINGVYERIISFINSLNDITALRFSLPTANEWKFAASGGSLTNNYTYSGSNIADDVAWYSLNSSNKTHDVKSKAPNELGLYDMSGNVAEMVILSNTFYYYGGDYKSSESQIHTDSNEHTSTTYSTNMSIGIRLKLSF